MHSSAYGPKADLFFDLEQINEKLLLIFLVYVVMAAFLLIP